DHQTEGQQNRAKLDQRAPRRRTTSGPRRASAFAALRAPGNARPAGHFATEVRPGCPIAVNRLAFGEGIAPPTRAILPDGERLPALDGCPFGILFCLASAVAVVEVRSQAGLTAHRHP